MEVYFNCDACKKSFPFTPGEKRFYRVVAVDITKAGETEEWGDPSGVLCPACFDSIPEPLEALVALVADLVDVGDDRHPETGEVYSAVAKAQQVIANTKKEPKP